MSDSTTNDPLIKSTIDAFFVVLNPFFIYSFDHITLDASEF